LTIRIDLHVHSMYSVDSTIRPEQLAFYARKRGLDGVAVTDHDRLDSALKISRESNFLILPGMEVTSLDGHIVGLDLKEPVPKGLTAEETVDRIHNAGGIAIACHPSAFFKGSLGKRATSRFDAIEVINSSAIPFRYSVRRSEELASRLGIPRVAGSDAHYGPEIGCAYTEVKAELVVQDIISAIKKGMCQPFGKGIPVGMRLRREFLSFRKSRLS
jgi:predicted metal-dependent phosphoesterase TrpH